MKFTGQDHTFVLCAYKENPHLEACLKSLVNQTIKGHVMISTSTPNEYIQKLGDKYKAEIVVNEDHHILGDDWNYGYDQAKTKLVTVAHQDDIYDVNYRKYVVNAANKRSDALLIHTGYYEVKRGKEERNNILLLVKRVMNAPLIVPLFWRSRWIRRTILAFGCPICCPSVTLIKANVGHGVYNTTFKNSCDYETWVRLSSKKGSFVYIPKQLMAHRIYAESETTKNLQENIRKKEDLEVMSTLWPRAIAKWINSVYALSEKSNKV